ncbi:MAG: AI-2E family transporter [Lachnospiraceae bacterium]|nr:AI-2E family transporter [Lachnospiraceae bacterium]
MKVEWKSCFKVGVSLFLLYLCITYWQAAANVAGLMFGAAMPLLIGCIIAYLVNILMSCYEKHYFPKSTNRVLIKSRRTVCMAAAFLTLAAVVYLIIRLILPQLWSCVEVIIAGVPGVLQKIVEFIEEYELLPENITETLENIDWRSGISQVAEVLTSGIGSVVDILITTVTSVFSGIVSALLSVIFAIYILSGKEKLSGQFRRLAQRYLKEKWVGKLDYVIGIINDCFHKYIVGQCTEAVIIGVLCALGMLLLKLPYATMIGALVAFTALIPVAGAYIGAFVGAFMILTVSPVKAIIFLVFIVVLQQLEGNIIYPKVVGSSLGLPGIWVLAAVTVGGGVLGIPGMLLGVPLAASVYRFIQNDVNKG